MGYEAKHVAEYAALRAVGALVNLLPYRAALALAWLIARLSFHLSHDRVTEAVRRLQIVFGADLPLERARKIAWQSWRNIAFDGVEMLLVGRMTRRWLDRRVDSVETMRVLVEHARTGRGAVLALPHMGNWEMGAVVAHRHGLPLFSIAATQRNPLVNRYMNELRRRPGIDTLARGSGTMREVIRRLRSGGMLAILPDVRVREAGIRVPFFGAEANVGPGMALFAHHANCPIFPCIATRHGWARHVHTVAAPLWPDPTLPKHEDVRRMTVAVLAAIEAHVRKDPGQWFWFNRRWILDPLDAPPTAPAPTQEAAAREL